MPSGRSQPAFSATPESLRKFDVGAARKSLKLNKEFVFVAPGMDLSSDKIQRILSKVSLSQIKRCLSFGLIRLGIDAGSPKSTACQLVEPAL